MLISIGLLALEEVGQPDVLIMWVRREEDATCFRYHNIFLWDHEVME